MIHQQLWFYPDIDKCIQGCFHCPRAIQSIWESSTISQISDIQMEVTTKTLKAFENEWKNNISTLNLSWYLWSYDFELFSNLSEHDIKQIYFNLGTLWKESIEFLDVFNEKFKKIFPIGSWKYMELYGNLQHNSWIFTKQDLEILEIFFTKYRNVIKEENKRLQNTNETNLLISSNNITNKNFKNYWKKGFKIRPISKLLYEIHKINIKSLSKNEIKSSEPTFEDFYQYWLVIANSRIEKTDESLQTIDFRWINAKLAQEQDFKTDLIWAIQDKTKLLVDIFPDKIVVYHNTKYINEPIYWFTYEEFFWVLNRSLNQWLKLKDEIDNILIKRLKEV